MILTKKSILIVTFLMLIAVSVFSRLTIGITLHPYYSYVANIVKDRADILPLIEAGFNVHNYDPKADDIKRITKMDVIVVNGIGHDEFAFEAIKAADMKDKLQLIYANDGVAMIPAVGINGSENVNPHTFISINASIQQIYHIAGELAKIDPENGLYFKKNAREYSIHLRKIKAEYMKKLSEYPQIEFKCATIHDAYSYLLQEFGLQVSEVIEPSHGLEPTANQLKETIYNIKTTGVDIIFSEMDFPSQYVEIIQDAADVKLYNFSHITKGDYSPTIFEEEMRKNLDNLTSALIYVYEKESSKK